MAGYSQTPLWKKLGVRAGSRLTLVGAPADLALGEMPAGAEIRRTTRTPRPGSDPAPTIVAFHRRRAALVRALPGLARAIFPDGAVWIAWPRRARGGESDIGDATVRKAALALGLVDVKVAALAPDWSGLRLVWRRELRTATATARAANAPARRRG